MTIKKELIKHFRRTDISFARRLRLLDDYAIESIFSESNNPPKPKNQALPLSLMSEINLFRENYTYLSPILQSLDVEEKLKLNAFDASALLSIKLNTLNSDDDLEHAYHNALMKTETPPNKPINTLFSLAQKLETLSPSDCEDLPASHDYFKRCIQCLQNTNKQLHTVKSDFAKKLPIQHFEHAGCSIFCIQDSFGENFDCGIARSLFSLPKETPALIVSDSMKDGAIRIFDSSSFSEEHLNTLPFHISLKDKKGSVVFRELADVPSLNTLYNNNQEATLDKIGMHWSKSILEGSVDNKRTQLHPADLVHFRNAFNTLGKERAPKPESLCIELSPNQTWFFLEEGKIKRSLLKDIPASTRTIFSSEHKDSAIQVPYSVIKNLTHSGNFDISLSDFNEWLIDKKTPTSAIVDQFPRIDKKIKIAAKKHFKKQKTPGYIEHQYTDADLKLKLAEQSLSNDWLNNSLLELNSSTNSEAVFDIDIRSTSGENSVPYFIKITALSAQKNGPYVRNISCCINHGDTQLTEEQLLELGMSQSEFTQHALSVKEAQNHLLKPFNQIRNKGTLFFHNTSASLPVLKKTFPLLIEKTKTWTILDKQKLIKENGLASRQGNIITITTEKNNAKPFHFRDSVGTECALKEKLKKGSGNAISLCGNATIKIKDKVVFLVDQKNKLSTNLGNSKDFLYKLHSQTKPMGLGQKAGSIQALYSHHTVMRMLQRATPKRQFYTPPMINIPNKLLEHKETGVIESLKLNYLNIIKNIPLHFTPNEMMQELERDLTLKGINPNQILSGGVGGKKGIEFLNSLKEESPELFAAVTYGKNINLDRLLSGSQSIRISKEQASLTYRDYLLANVFSLHRHNQDISSHFQLADIAPLVFERLEPTTSVPPDENIEALSKYTGTSTAGLRSLYSQAYQFKQHQNQSYQSFLNDNEKWLPFADSGLVSIASIIGGLQIKDSSTSNWINKIEQHNQQIKIEQVASLSIPEYENSFSNQLLDDSKKVITTSNSAPIPSKLLPSLSEALELLKLSNGMHNIISRNNNTTPPETIHENYQNFSSTIYDPRRVDKLNELNKDLTEAGITSLNLLPSKVEAKQFVISIINAAIDDNDLLNFNTSFNHESLSEIEVNLKTHIPLLGLNHHSINSRISEIIQRKKIEFTCVNSVDELFKVDNYVVTDDKVANKRNFETQHKLSNSNYTPVTYQELVNIILNQGHLPKSTADSLYVSSQSGFSELPKEHFANQIFKRIRYNARHIHSPFPVNKGPFDDIQKQFKIASNNPLDKASLPLVFSLRSECRQETYSHNKLKQPQAQRNKIGK